MTRVLVISPHPDDEAIGCGGALVQHLREGAVVRVIFLTSGEQGCHGESPVKAAQVREAEATAASTILGITEHEFWRQPDGQLAADSELIQRLQRILVDWSPTFLYGPHGEESHADHRAAFQLIQLACRHLPPAVPAPHVRLYEIWTPLQQFDEIIDISPFIAEKIAAIRAHESQCRVMRFDEAFLGLNRYRGEMHSWPGGDYAEVFQCLRL